MANITDDKVIKLLKSNPGESMQWYANKLGVALGAIGGYVYRLEPVADPSLKINVKGGDVAVNKRIVLARNDQGLRWERIAARTGFSVADVKKRYKAGGGGDPNKSYSGRGRDFSGVARKPAAAKSGTGKGRGTGTSGRAAAARGGGKSTDKPKGRTRAQAQGTGTGKGRGRKDPS